MWFLRQDVHSLWKLKTAPEVPPVSPCSECLQLHQPAQLQHQRGQHEREPDGGPPARGARAAQGRHQARGVWARRHGRGGDWGGSPHTRFWKQQLWWRKMILNPILSKKSFLLELISTFNFVKALKAKYYKIFWQFCIYLKLQLWEALICQKFCIRHNE